jgi:asparagine synthase (glutamine-hydrolysing)
MDQFYATAFLSDRSTQDRTPYETIRAVPAAHFIVFGKDGAERRQRHWKPLPHYSVRYSGDSEYEEHFLALFKQSVARRTGAGAPILAHLSGGMDSSTIVCVSDLLRTSEGDSYPELLNTLSFYDDTEPNWNERPFFSAVEAQRGKIGLRVDLSMVRPTFQSPALNGGQCLPLPGADSGVLEQSERLEGQIAECGYRVLLSGIGGDELLGGIPTPLPELSDYLVTFDFRSLLHKGFEWCLALRKPLLGLLWETLTFSAAAYLQPVSSTVETPPWFTDSRRKMPWNPSKGPQNRPLHWRPSPSAIVTARTWNTLTETLPNSQLASGERREYRFPYLDRDLVDFLLRIPNEQLVRPGRRRSLMRRAVRGIVPDSVLERRRKGFVSRGPSVWLADAKDRIDRIMERSILARHGYVDRHAFVVCLQQAIAGTHPQWSSPLMRTCLFESWLQSGALVSMPTERLHRFRR